MHEEPTYKEARADVTLLLLLQIGRSNMYEDHQKLKSSCRAIAALEVQSTRHCGAHAQAVFHSWLALLQNSLQQRKTNHVDLKQKNDLISTDVERFRNRESFLQEVDCLKKKKYWMVRGFQFIQLCPLLTVRYAYV